jgi:hypothetical protein
MNYTLAQQFANRLEYRVTEKMRGLDRDNFTEDDACELFRESYKSAWRELAPSLPPEKTALVTNGYLNEVVTYHEFTDLSVYVPLIGTEKSIEYFCGQVKAHLDCKLRNMTTEEIN